MSDKLNERYPRREKEDAYRERVLQTIEPDLFESGMCQLSRGQGMGSNKCCNDSHCGSKLTGTVGGVHPAIMSLRKSLWLSPTLSRSWGLRRRKEALFRQLSSYKCVIDGLPSFNYAINGIRVCKHYYRRATGFERKLFNAVHTLVSHGHTQLRERGKRGSDDVEEDIVSFLDVYFQTNSLVEHDPQADDVKLVRKKWTEVYMEDYRPWCVDAEVNCAAYNVFTSVRKLKRPNYRKSKKIRDSGWDHLGCGKCEKLREEILAAQDYNSKRKLKRALYKHKALAKAHREHYKKNRSKACQPDYKKRNMSLIVDAAGGTGSTYTPHFSVSAKGEPARHSVLRVHSTFAKVHGLGTYIFVMCPGLEAGGSNMVLEIIYRCVDLFLANRNIKRFDTLHLQMDNQSINKSWAFMAGMAALVSLRIVRKVKISYCVVGHTHEDIDAIIGSVITKLRRKDQITMLEFAKQAEDAINKKHAKVLGVSFLKGIPDYGSMLKKGFDPCHIAGITQCQEFRLTRSADGSNIDLHYKEYCNDEGWLPRPVPPSDSFKAQWAEAFQCSIPGQGVPIALQMTPITDRGLRQCWRCNVTFTGGEVEEFVRPSPSLPVYLDREELVAKLNVGVGRQPFDPEFFKSISSVKDNVFKLLRLKLKYEKFHKEWEDVFEELPSSKLDSRYLGLVHDSGLHHLYLRYVVDNYDPVTTEAQDDIQEARALDFTDPLTFTGGPVTAKRRYEEFHIRGLRVLKRARQKRIFDDDEPDFHAIADDVDNAATAKQTNGTRKRKEVADFITGPEAKERKVVIDGTVNTKPIAKKQKRKRYRYVQADREVCPADLVEKIGKKFLDIGDGAIFLIVDIVRCEEHFPNSLLFEYRRVSTANNLSDDVFIDNSINHSSCAELMANDDWSRWII